jgi:cytochrome d ubiquinol oxidase subunit I
VVVYSSLFVTYIYFIRKLILKGPPSLDEVQASLINPLLDGHDDLPATLNPAQVDIGYSQELSEYLNKQDQHKQDKGEK